MARAMADAIFYFTAEFGKGAIGYGAVTGDQSSKIAFQRVPKVKEF